MVRLNPLVALWAASMAPAVLAHPGDDDPAMMKREMAQRSAQHQYASRSLAKCQDTPQALAMRKRSAERRAAKAAELREKRGLTAGVCLDNSWFQKRWVDFG